MVVAVRLDESPHPLSRHVSTCFLPCRRQLAPARPPLSPFRPPRLLQIDIGDKHVDLSILSRVRKLQQIIREAA